jgi:hypothetical protein
MVELVGVFSCSGGDVRFRWRSVLCEGRNSQQIMFLRILPALAESQEGHLLFKLEKGRNKFPSRK